MTSYLVDGNDLTAIADAIRLKGSTSSSLAFPGAFVSAINAIPAGGSDEDKIIARTISGFYENSTAATIGEFAFARCESLTAVKLAL